ncbi:MAG: hypothetical protein M5U01_25415 [Ardenticatenaceae bacterium]|nr:hypothetical protein [Ardenticatenaceae bacterium]HBY92797.1 hypothetical protein [Chloroflexota bacterium]
MISTNRVGARPSCRGQAAQTPLLAAGLLLVAMFLPGCSLGRPLLFNVSVAPTTISPNADGHDDIAVIRYKLGGPALVSIWLEDRAGQKRFWRDHERRSAGNDYESWFWGGVDNRVLPDGTYTLVVQAEPLSGGQASAVTSTLTITNGDSQVPAIENLMVAPPVFTPNRDGVGDHVKISYSLVKAAERLTIKLVGPDGREWAIPEDQIRDATAAGYHIHDFDGGVDLGAEPPPDGDYTVVVEATDQVGNKDRQTAALRIDQGGIPRAQIVRNDASFSTTVLRVGDTLTFTATVQNSGDVPIRTHGPEPGTTYTSDQNYNAFDEPIESGAFRIGLDYEGSYTANGFSYPFRWQLGRDDELTVIDGHKYLMPGQTVTITGTLTLVKAPPREAPAFWVGLIHEDVENVADRVGWTYITVDRIAR